jgi:hypothetical protein
MRATLKYDLPEERLEFDDAFRGSEYKAALHDLDGDLRAALKHSAFPEWELSTVEAIREKLWQHINDRNLNLD